MARESDLVIVVGGFNSANTRHLAEICSPVAETWLIESAAEIKPGWVKGKKRIGVTAGASTPDEAIDEVIKRLEELTGRV
jgi:4-hydroxy-3-methylbut-2-en-1-yl diphosphate reductase